MITCALTVQVGREVQLMASQAMQPISEVHTLLDPGDRHWTIAYRDNEGRWRQFQIPTDADLEARLELAAAQFPRAWADPVC